MTSIAAKPESAPTTPYGSRTSSWSGSMSPMGSGGRGRGCTAYLPTVSVRRFQPTGECICVVHPTSVAAKEDNEEALAFNAFLLGPGSSTTSKAGC